MASSFDDLACDIWENIKCVFGEDVTFKPKSGGSFSIKAAFDNTFQQVDPDTEQVIATNQPVLGLKQKDLPFKLRKGDIFVVRGERYRVIDSQEDGIAGIQVFLHKIRCTT